MYRLGRNTNKIRQFVRRDSTDTTNSKYSAERECDDPVHYGPTLSTPADFTVTQALCIHHRVHLSRR